MKVQNVKSAKLGGVFSWSQVTLTKGIKESFILQGGAKDLELEISILISKGAEIGINVTYTPIMDTHKNNCSCCGAVVSYSDDMYSDKCSLCYFH